LVKRLVDELNGNLSVESEKGKGAQFKITLPQ
jgi:chemotaxis protein histidine kinase CheA